MGQVAVRNGPQHTGKVEADLTSFVGRRREITEIRRMLGSARLVTLTGVGGTGKTRLALRVAAAARRAFADGVWQVDLTTVRDPTMVEYTVAEALPVGDQYGRPVADVLADYLRQRKLLLVLDNCEHVLDALAVLVGLVLEAAPGVRVLATSRQPLSIVGEQVWTVPPFAVPDADGQPSPSAALRYPAVSLFAQRAAAVRPGLTLAGKDAVLAASICRQLDGLPLAIELAAAQLRTMSLRQLEADLAKRLPSRPAQQGPEHHRTMQAAFDWSFALCTPAEQKLWAAVSVFAGSFDLSAAEEVCGPELPGNDVLTPLIGLVDKSVLLRDDAAGQARYRLLETVRRYGLDRLDLDNSGRRALSERHAVHYLRIAEQAEADWSGPEQHGTHLRMRREYPNLRAALGYCLSTPGMAHTGTRLVGTLWFHWTLCGYLHEGRRWLDRFLAADSTRGPHRTKALWTAGAVAVAQGDMEAANRRLADCVREATREGDELILALTDLSLGTVALFAEDYARARADFERALARFDAIGVVNSSMLMGRSELALVMAAHGDLDGAEAYCRETLRICEQRRDGSASAWVFHVLTGIALARGDLKSGIVCAREGLRRHHAYRNVTGIAMLAELFTLLLAMEGQAERAAVLHGALDGVWQLVGSRLFGSASLTTQRMHAEAAARHALGGRYEQAFQRGARLDLDEAIAYALEEPGAARRSSGSGPELTPREREVAELIGLGMTNRDIAARLVTSQRTAEYYVENILRKLGFTSRSQIAAWISSGSPDVPPEA